MSVFPRERSDRNDFLFFQCHDRAKKRRKGGTLNGKALPIPSELSKGDPFLLLPVKNQVHDFYVSC